MVVTRKDQVHDRFKPVLPVPLLNGSLKCFNMNLPHQRAMGNIFQHLPGSLADEQFDERMIEHNGWIASVQDGFYLRTS